MYFIILYIVAQHNMNHILYIILCDAYIHITMFVYYLVFILHVSISMLYIGIKAIDTPELGKINH